jgi:peptidoglycan/LPS O-acetylase OafA/YrhL
MAKAEYRADIDGIRGLAVLTVLLFHLDPVKFPGGFVGVDIFFVLSGFLITGIIIKDLNNSLFAMRSFFERRIRRILPALVTMEICLLVAGYFLFVPSDFRMLGKALIAQTLMVSNFFFLGSSGYFSATSERLPLLHTWSLSVEEQFYFLFPIVILLCFRNGGNAKVKRWLLGVACFSFLAAIYGTYTFPNASFYLLPTRAWELLVGALIATLPRSAPGRWVSNGVAFGAIGILAFCTFGYTKETRFPGLNAFYPCAATGALIYTGTIDRTIVSRLLSSRALVYFGLISYSLYLWHWPLIGLIKQTSFSFGARQKLSAIALSIGIAHLSWIVVEQRFRRSVRQNASWKTIKIAGLVNGVILLFGVLISLMDGIPGRFSKSELESLKDVDIGLLEQSQSSVNEVIGDSLPNLGITKFDGITNSFLVWGDSHAAALAGVFDRAAKERGLSGKIAARGGTPPLLGVHRPAWRTNNQNAQGMVDWNNSVLEYIKSKKINNVILIAAWQIYVEWDEGALAKDGVANASLEESYRILDSAMKATVAELEKANVKVWVIKQVPYQDVDVGKVARLNVVWSREAKELQGVTREQHSKRQAKVNLLLEQMNRGHTIVKDPSDAFFKSSDYSVLSDGNRYTYSDPTHLSDYGAERILASFVGEICNQIGRRTN